MNSYNLSVAGINVAEGISRFNGMSSLYEKYLNKFPDDGNYIKLKEALDVKNVEDAFKYAHALKGLAGNLSLKGLYDAVEPLVEILRVSSLNQTEELFIKVTLEYEKTVSAILSQT